VLNVSERGDRAVIGKFEGQDLTHPWSGNVVDLCPVGALLSKDFLNKARAWELDRSASVCPNCTQGCNTIVETRDNMVVRLRPRPNEDVNKYFMCDYGRLNYRWMNRTDRVEAPLVRQGDRLAAAEWDVAIATAAKALEGKRIHAVVSPSLSNEALFLLSRLLEPRQGSGAFRVERGPEAPLAGVEDLALRADRAANVQGAELFGFRRSDSPLAGLRGGDALLFVDADPSVLDMGDLTRAAAVVVIGTTLPDVLRTADAVLPIANMVEEEGTFTNLRGRVQRFLQARAAPGMARPSWWVLGDLLARMGEPGNYFLASDVFAALASARSEFANMSYDTIGLRGLPVLAAAGVR
jgi:NADH-quinone oxidoreductase subunit G